MELFSHSATAVVWFVAGVSVGGALMFFVMSWLMFARDDWGT